MLLAALISSAFACDSSDLVRSLDAGEAAFSATDQAGLDQARKDARATLACSNPTPEQLARLHRLNAYAASLSGNTTSAIESWRASIAAFPLLPALEAQWKYPSINIAWARAQEKGVRYTLTPGSEPLAGLKTPLVPDTVGVRGGGGKRDKTIILAAGAGLVAASAVMYGSAFGTRGKYNKLKADNATADELRGSYVATNTLTIAALPTFVVGGALVVVSFTR